MDYLFLILAVIGFAVQFVVTKFYELSIKQVLATSLTFFVVISAVTSLVCLCVGKFRIEFSLFSLVMALLMAVMMLSHQIAFIKVISLGDVGIVTMFTMLGGMALPFLYGVIFLGEELTIPKLIGVITLSAFLIIQSLGGKKTDNTRRGGALFYILCLLTFVTNGMISVFIKMHQIGVGAVSSESYMIWYSVISAALGLAVLVPLLIGKKNSENRKLTIGSIRGKPLIFAVVSALLTCLANYLNIFAAKTVPASLQFPVVSGGVMVITSTLAFICFKEKPNKKGLICLVGAFLSTILFMF